MKTGEELLQKKDYSRAVLQFMNAAKLAPTDAEPQYQLALTYLQLRDYRNAVVALRKAIELNPKHTGAQLKLAELMASASDKDILQDAKQRLDAILSESPENSEAATALSVTEARLGNADEATRTLEDALQKAPADLRASVTLARLKMSQKDQAGAEQALKDAVKQAPQSVDAALALSQFYVAIKKPDQAETEVRRALQLDPKSGPALLTLAYAQIAQNEADQAEQTYRQVSALPDKQYKPLHAIYLIRTGKADAGVAELEKLTKSEPKDRDFRTQLIAAYLATNKQAEAEKVLSDAIKAQANDSLALSQRSEIYLRQGKYGEAEKDLQQLSGLQTKSASVHYALARVRAASGATVGERQELEEALRLDPKMLVARLELMQVLLKDGQGKAALDVVNQTPDAQKSDPSLIAASAAAYLGMGDQATARKEVDRGLAVRRIPILLIQDATLKAVQKDYAGARLPLEEILKAQPLNMQAWGLMLQTYAAEKQPAKAVQRLREGVAQSPKSSRLQFMLAELLMQTGDRKDARTALAAAVALEPALPGAQTMQVQLDMADGKFDAARQSLNEAIAKNPKNAQARLMLADVEDRAGNHAGAVAQYRAVVNADPNNVGALNNLAWSFVKDKPDEGLKYAQQAAKIAPDNPSVQDTLGWLYYRTGVYDSAVTHLKTAVSKEGTPQRKYHLGMALTKAGDQDQGRKMVRAALDSDPTLAKNEGN